jgi:hypothetical protein
MPKTVKALVTISAGNRLANNEHSGRESGPAIKLKQSEVIKALLLGYLEPPTEEALINLLIESNYDLQTLFRYDKVTPLSAKIDKVDSFVNNLNKPVGGGYEWGENYSRTVGSNIGYQFVRSSKQFEENHAIKWRKPSKSSSWPWTLDHHWFIVQESPITLANYTYKALLGAGGQNNYQKRDKIDAQYPIFHKNNAVDQGRRLLEIFFKHAVGNRSKSKWGEVVHCTQLMRWTSDNPCFIIPKLCMVLGVMPTFDDCGSFEKFVPLAGNFKQPNKKLYLEFNAVDIEQSSSLEPFITVTLGLCYDLGVLKLNAIEKILGVVNAGAALENNSNYFRVSMGNNIVCCVPNDYSYNIINKAISKFEANNNLNASDEPVFSSY